MLRAIHLLLVLLYALLPVGMLWWMLVRRTRQRRVGAVFSLLTLLFIGIVTGIVLVMINGQLMSITTSSRMGVARVLKTAPGHISYGEAARFIYFIIGALCVIRLMDRLTFKGIFKLARVPLDEYARPTTPNQPRALLALFCQRLLMLLLVIPYLISLMMVYRPRVFLEDDPRQHQLAYVDASFVSDDGVALAGWWIDAVPRPRMINSELGEDWGKRTVVLCHGVGSSKERQLDLAQYLTQRGYNVLVFDFRGHGQSAGNFISYGVRERLDVMAAIAWAKEKHPDQAEHLFGIGSNCGAAALVGAATEKGPGEQLEGIVLYEPFARFDDVVRENAKRLLPGPASWLVRYISVPLASLHTGANLGGFAPEEIIDQVWPRPVLVVQGRAQTFVSTEQSMDLYQQASQPKEQFFPGDNYYQQRARAKKYYGRGVRMLSEMFKEYVGTSDAISDDPGVRFRTIRFLHDAGPVPIL
jgi:alpha/beta superfamily hydrolase